jgi:ATP-dependent helicase/DNAse subunit B
MADYLKTRVIVEQEDELKLFDSTDKDAFVQLGIELNQEFKHYSVTVGTILNFREMVGHEGAHEVTHIQTLTYPKTQREGDSSSFDVVIIYSVKRLFKISN